MRTSILAILMLVFGIACGGSTPSTTDTNASVGATATAPAQVAADPATEGTGPSALPTGTADGSSALPTESAPATGTASPQATPEATGDSVAPSGPADVPSGETLLRYKYPEGRVLVYKTQLRGASPVPGPTDKPQTLVLRATYTATVTDARGEVASVRLRYTKVSGTVGGRSLFPGASGDVPEGFEDQLARDLQVDARGGARSVRDPRGESSPPAADLALAGGEGALGPPLPAQPVAEGDTWTVRSNGRSFVNPNASSSVTTRYTLLGITEEDNARLARIQGVTEIPATTGRGGGISVRATQTFLFNVGDGRLVLSAGTVTSRSQVRDRGRVGVSTSKINVWVTER